MSKKLRRVEFGGEIRVNLQYKVAIIIMRMRNETAHAQYTIMVKGGGCKKVMRALMRN